MADITMEEGFKKLDTVIGQRWGELLSPERLQKLMAVVKSKDRRAYAILLIQIYHYAYHMARNQALVGANLSNTNTRYMKYCFEHALEETGHELMALHDLRKMGVAIEDPRTELPDMLPGTEQLTAYIYWVSTQGNPVQRLGFTYWAERSYEFLNPFIGSSRSDLGLEKSAMTFFFSHAHVDEKHAEDVKKIISEICTSAKDWRALERTASISLQITTAMIDHTYEEYLRVRDGQPSDYASICERVTQ